MRGRRETSDGINFSFSFTVAMVHVRLFYTFTGTTVDFYQCLPKNDFYKYFWIKFICRYFSPPLKHKFLVFISKYDFYSIGVY
jgi:hypothetical protein